MSEFKEVNYGELDCKLSDYIATDGVILKSAMTLSGIIDDILKIVNECSYPNYHIEQKLSVKDAEIERLKKINTTTRMLLSKRRQQIQSLASQLEKAEKETRCLIETVEDLYNQLDRNTTKRVAINTQLKEVEKKNAILMELFSDKNRQRYEGGEFLCMNGNKNMYTGFYISKEKHIEALEKIKQLEAGE